MTTLYRSNCSTSMKSRIWSNLLFYETNHRIIIFNTITIRSSFGLITIGSSLFTYTNMDYFTAGESIDKPCKETLAHPLECFVEIFLATPAVVGTFLVSTSGFLLALVLWMAIVSLVLYSIYYIARTTYRALKCALCHTRLGSSITKTISSQFYLPKPACCRRAAKLEQIEKKTDDKTTSYSNSETDIGKAHHDSRWKSPFKHLSLGKTSTSSPSKQKSPAKLTISTPKLLKAKAIK